MAEQLRAAQLTRLLSTTSGQRILQDLGELPDPVPPMPTRAPPPWEPNVELTDDAPLPSRMGLDHPQRRQYHAQAHEIRAREREAAEHVYIYTDAAQRRPTEVDRTTCTAVAWVDINTKESCAQLLAYNIGIYGAELEALLRAARHAEARHAEDARVRKVTIFTDSQEAYLECRKAISSKNRKVQELHDIAKRLRIIHQMVLKIDWVPAHTGIRGNEWAHREAREKVSITAVPNATSIQGGPTVDTVKPIASRPSKIGWRARTHRMTDTDSETSASDSDEPKKKTTSRQLRQDAEGLDECTEQTKMAKQRRKDILLRLRQEASIDSAHDGRPTPPMPPGLCRAAQVLVRRIATNTVLTPALRARIFGRDSTGGRCRQCGVGADLFHLAWTCPIYEGARQQALDGITAAHRPRTFEEWVSPRTTEAQVVQQCWYQLHRFFTSEGGPGVPCCSTAAEVSSPSLLSPPLPYPLFRRCGCRRQQQHQKANKDVCNRSI